MKLSPSKGQEVIVSPSRHGKWTLAGLPDAEHVDSGTGIPVHLDTSSKIEGHNMSLTAMTGAAQWAGCHPTDQKVTGFIPGQGTCQGFSQVPGWGHGRGNLLVFLSHINVSLPLFLHPCPSV